MIELLNLDDSWKQIEEFPKYWISNKGVVLSTQLNGVKFLKNKDGHKTGHLSVNLVKDRTLYIILSEYIIS